MFFLLYQKELEEKNSLIINCKVKAGASNNEIVGFLDERTIKLNIKKPALNNQANLELIKYLKKILSPAKVEIKILKGKTNSLKTLKIIKL
jgi:uncharacterized protein